MRGLTVAIFAVALSLCATRPSAAWFDSYNEPWCAYLVTFGSSDCAYATLEQCKRTLSGIGGWCEPNLRLQADMPRRRHSRYVRRPW